MEQHLQRIRQMESYYDTLLCHEAAAILANPVLLALAAELEEYLSCSLWLADYTRDEQGLLPPDLKRGVLSQDGLYDLLSHLGETKSALDNGDTIC